MDITCSYRRIVLGIILVILDVTANNGQTSEIANYEVYTRESNVSSIGYFTASIELPGNFGVEQITQHGISYNHFYDITNFGSIPFDYDHQISFYLSGAFRIAGATGRPNLSQPLPASVNSNPKFYTVNIDIYSLYFVPEYTYVIKRGYAITAKLGINLINIGGTLSFPEKGKINDHLFGTINLLPLDLAPSFFFDFGRSGVGLLFHINPANFLSYNIAPRELFGDNRGITSYNTFVKRYDIELIFIF